MSRIQPLIWNKTGNDWIRDGLTGRLGAPKRFGDTIVSGATNAVAIRETSGGSTFYIGSVNGGVYSRRYDKTTDTWEDQWTWISKPSSGYSGGQSIGALALSADGQYLAVGQGNPSNYGAIGTPSSGIQIGKIAEDGAIEWLAITPETSEILKGINIRSLEWRGKSVFATGWDGGADWSEGNIMSATVEGDQVRAAEKANNFNLQIEQTPTGTLIAAGYELQSGNINNSLFSANADLSLDLLDGKGYSDYIQELNQGGYAITRIAAHPRLVDGKIILFVGSSLKDAISRIDRLVFEPGNLELTDVSSFQAGNMVGTGQAENLKYYGNFSLASDPFDTTGSAVYAGGNGYWYSPVAPSILTTGGLVRVGFKTDATPEAKFLYGPHLENGQFEISRENPPTPGAPHADSRAISFYTAKDGPRLVQTDDGGIWQLRIEADLNGSQPANKAWWTSLTTDGLNTLEVMMADWGSQANIIASSYQDNGASLGYHGDAFATNLWVGDGEIAVIDDGGDERQKTTGYLSYYWYLSSGSMQKYVYNSQGFVEGMQYVDFYLQPELSRKPISWDQTPESRYYSDQKVSAPFLLPFEENAYRQGSMVMIGSVNAYETIRAKGSKLVFRPLLAEQTPLLTENKISKNITALDNQGSAGSGKISELYLATSDRTTKSVQILGRDESAFNANTQSATIRPLSFSNLSEQGLSEAGTIIDIAHQPNKSGSDRLYWLQGGKSVLFRFGMPSQQVLRIGSENQEALTFSLDELGISTDKSDSHGMQSITYVPKNSIHGEKIVVAGLSGAWISDLDAEGVPKGFSAMNWSGLPESVAPGSYIHNVKYEPGDDLLILNTLGQGNWIYSFSGELGDRPAPKELLILPNTTLPIQNKADLNKRGDQINQTIAFQLDGRLQSKDRTTRTEIVLHQPERWRKHMDIVSPYHVQTDAIEDLSARERANDWVNLLRPKSLEYRGGYETENEIVMPFPFYPGISMFNLTINPKEYTKPNTVKLDYTFRLADGSESVTRTLTLKPDDRFHSKASRDVITGKSTGHASLMAAETNLGDVSATTQATTQYDRKHAGSQDHGLFVLDSGRQLMSLRTTDFEEAFGQHDSSTQFGVNLIGQGKSFWNANASDMG